jgi:putative ABC transport system permease protein
MKPTIAGIRLSTLTSLYGWRLRRRAGQELLAGSGIAVGVALVFGVLVANTSIISSSSQLLHQLIGTARVQLVARSDEGFEEKLAVKASRLPGVQVSAWLLREDATILAGGRSRSIQLIGVTPGLIALDASAARDLGSGALLLAGGLGLPGGVAEEIGVRPGDSVRLRVDGEVHTVSVRAVLGSQAVGAVASSPVAIALLKTAQKLTGKTGRVTDVLIKPRPGADRQVAGELEALAAGRIDVVGAKHELRLLEAAAKPNQQSTTLFAAISAMVGFLLALNAMLLTVPERRRFIAELRTQGFAPGQVVLIMGFQALVLGLGASLVGVLLGDVLSNTVFHQVPDYLTFAFPVGTERILSLTTTAIALGCGLLAALLASLPPIFDLRSRRSVDAVLQEAGEAGQSVSARTVRGLSLLGAALIIAVFLLTLAFPSLAVVGGVVLALAVVCLIPCSFALILWALAPLGERMKGSMLAMAMVELRASTTRSIALAAVAALAVYGSVAIGGAQHDLLRGLDRATVEFFETADLWVTTGANDLTTSAFQPDGTQLALSRSPLISAVRTYQGGFLDVGSRRLWIRARPPQDRAMLQASQLLEGDLARATQRLREGGWVALSGGLAAERDLHVGDQVTLPTPSGPARFRVAAVMTNVGWPPGAITLNTTDYRRYWQTDEPTALEVSLRPGVAPAAGSLAVQRILRGRPGLAVQTTRERVAQFERNARSGLKNLGEISNLLLVAAALAVASALSAAIWQRRARLASLKAQGFDRWQLWRSLLLESVIVLSIGCADGVLLGVFGHALASRWLAQTTGFPAPFSLGGYQVLLTLALVGSIALAVVAMPGFRAAQVSPQAGFRE